MNTIDVIKRIASYNPDIDYFRLVTYKGPKDLALDYATSWTMEDEAVYNAALKMKYDYNLPFWNALMLSIMNRESTEIPQNCLIGTSRHNKIEQFRLIKASTINEIGHIDEQSERIGINSKVVMKDGSDVHIPMLDFHIPFSERNISIVKEICRMLGLKGYILASGKSFHFIGIELIDMEAMFNYLGRALLFTPIVDIIWIAHQLQEQSCTLRIVKKHGVNPSVVAEV